MGAFTHAFSCTALALALGVAAPSPGLAPVTHSTRAFTLAGSDLIPEAIAYDERDARWFVSSVRQARIMRVDGATFAKSPWPVFALAIDAKRRLLWASTAAVPQCAVCTDTTHEGSALLAFDLDSGALRQRIASPIGGVLGDMVLAPNGDLYVSEGIHGAVFQLPRGGKALRRLDTPGSFRSPQTPALSADGKTLFVPDYARGIAALDLHDKHLRWLQAAAGITLNGIDGLYIDRGDFIGIQNGATPERIVRIAADLQSLTVLEANWPELGEPTHGAIVGQRFYFLANTGWNAFDEQGRKLPGLAAVASSIWSFPLDAVP